MKIRSLYILTLALFGLLLSLILMSIFITNQQVDRIGLRVDIALRIEREASELSYLSNEYLLYREVQQRARWEAKFAVFSADLSSLGITDPEGLALVENIRGSSQRLQAIFADVVANYQGAPGLRNDSINPALLQIPWSRMEVQNQAIVFDASRLSQLLNAQSDDLKQRNLMLVLALIGLFGAYFLVNFFLVYRRILSSIAKLQAGTLVIGAGNLDFAIPVKYADEIGDLSRAFNRMAADLKSVTASKTDLEREIAERRQAEEALRQAVHRIQQLNSELERRSADLQAANQNLEASLAQEQAARVESEATNKELEAFVYSVSHDLRAPLQQISELSRLVLEDYGTQLPEVSQPLLRIIHDHAAATNGLAEDLLALTRLTHIVPNLQTVKMSELVEQVLNELRAREGQRPLDIQVGDLPDARADLRLMKQVWVNLIANALKFTRPRDVARLGIGSLLEDGAHVYFVKDNGVGFDMAQVSRLFRAFHRLHHVEEFEGTGLGLAIVQRIVERHGGRAWAYGEVGKGAAFYFSLDCGKTDKAGAPATSPQV